MVLQQMIRRLSIFMISKPEFPKAAILSQSANWFATKKSLDTNVDAPKRPASAYILFYQEKYASNKGDVTKNATIAGEIWNSLPVNEKKIYFEKASASLQMYNDKVAQLTEEQKALIKKARQQAREEKLKKEKKLSARRERVESGQPKKPDPVLILWANEHRHLFKDVKGGLPLIRAQVQKWTELPEEEKKKYSDRFRQTLNEYNEKMKAWREKQSSLSSAVVEETAEQIPKST